MAEDPFKELPRVLHNQPVVASYRAGRRLGSLGSVLGVAILILTALIVIGFIILVR